MYLPATAMVTLCFGWMTRWTNLSQSSSAGDGVWPEFDVTPDGLRLIDHVPDVTVAELRAITGAPFSVESSLMRSAVGQPHERRA